MTQRTAPCALRALRELGYQWKTTSEEDRIESWVLGSFGELGYGCVYLNGDFHDVRAVVQSAMVAERSVDWLRGPTTKAIKGRARRIMAEFRALVERELVKDYDSHLPLVRGGGDAKQRRKGCRWHARLIAAARAEALKAVAP